jgi:glutamate racemase
MQCMAAQGKIGIFDSGFGGLHTLRPLVDALPAYDYVYLGDSARAPYGPRTSAEVYAFSVQAVDFLFARGCELVIFACNTASSVALRKIQRGYLPAHYPDKKVLGVSVPLAEAAAATTARKRVGVIATEGTVRSGVFDREIRKLDPSIEVFQQAAPRLVTLIEAGAHGSEAVRAALAEYLGPLLGASVDTLILGCTHYGLVIDAIRSMVGPRIAVVSESQAEPRALAAYLARHRDIDARLSRGGTIDFYSTDATGRFDELGSVFFGRPIKAQKINL